MSIEYSQEQFAPIISPTYAPQDAGEIGLRPKRLSEYTGQEKENILNGIKEGLEGLYGKIPGLIDIKVQKEKLESSNADAVKAHLHSFKKHTLCCYSQIYIHPFVLRLS